MLREISLSFARFAAYLERNYIFAWLDWDGDNVLANAGIIDYGSIRQFGLRHDQYRYDDVQRFSTNLNEQRGKARQLVQVFAQLVAFLETGKRRAVEEFENSTAVRDYDREFDREVRHIFLKQIGFDETQIEALISRRPEVEKLYSAFIALEKTKTQAPMRKVPDGVNRPAVFNMRAVLRDMPALLRTGGDWTTPSAQAVLDLMVTAYAKKVDKRLRGKLRERIDAFLKAYVGVMKAVCATRTDSTLKAIGTRALEMNRPGRITGNGAEFIVEAVMNARRRGISFADVQKGIELFVQSQSPTFTRSNQRKAQPTDLSSAAGRLFQELSAIALDWEEDI
jgi:hypothetical protein